VLPPYPDSLFPYSLFPIPTAADSFALVQPGNKEWGISESGIRESGIRVAAMADESNLFDDGGANAET
jgi:hypothetical protein